MTRAVAKVAPVVVPVESNGHAPPAPRLTMTSGEVALALGYTRRIDGHPPDRRKVYALCRARKIPPPIDDSLPQIDWRWSRALIEKYAAGEWRR